MTTAGDGTTGVMPDGMVLDGEWVGTIGTAQAGDSDGAAGMEVPGDGTAGMETTGDGTTGTTIITTTIMRTATEEEANLITTEEGIT